MISNRIARVVVAFAEALLPDVEGAAFSTHVEGIPQTLNQVFDPAQFDEPALRPAMPLLFRALNWVPVVCFWLIWRPVPFTWLSVANRRRLLARMEASRLYGLRMLLMTAKMFVCMALFYDEGAWPLVGFDGEGELPRTVNANPAYEAAQAS